MDELYSNPPRMFSLLKVVEISYYNMGRIRLQWSRIWQIVGEHFNKVRVDARNRLELTVPTRIGRLQSTARRVVLRGRLASAAVDEVSREGRIPELSFPEGVSQTIRDDHEEEPVRCFTSTVRAHRSMPLLRRSPTIRDMVVRCVTNFVYSQAKNIRSGWKNIFSVFQMAAADTDAQIVELAFQACTHIVGECT